MSEKMLDENVRGQVREFFADLTEPVAILFFGSQDEAACQYCEPTRQLLSEIVELSEKLSLQVFDLAQDVLVAERYGVDAVPTIVFVAKNGEELIDYGVRYKGIPAGHEFTSLVNTILIVSRRDSGLDLATRDFLKTLDRPVHLEVFVTPT
jgi:glutaredoxin-like protein